MTFQRVCVFLLATVCCTGLATGVAPIGRSLANVDAYDTLCCTFDSNACGSSATNYPEKGYWTWSGYGSIAPYVPAETTSNYVWSQNDNTALFGTTSVSILTDSTPIEFSYFASITDLTGYSGIIVYFMPATGSLVPLASLGDTAGVWQAQTLTCLGYSCCTTYPCDGRIIFEARTTTTSTELYAIDNVDVNSGCTVPPNYGCCVFNTYDVCGFSDITYPYITDSWEWSGYSSVPLSTFSFTPEPGYQYIFTQNNPSALTATSFYTVSETTEFAFNYYGEKSTISTSLGVYFVNADGITRDVLIDSLSGTVGAWQRYAFICETSSCCNTYPCTGQIRFEYQNFAAPVLYAIDKVEVNGACGSI